MICISCLCKKPELANPTTVLAEKVLEETKEDILDFLNDTKPKPKLMQPKFEIQLQDD
jgi:hypothetical protein